MESICVFCGAQNAVPAAHLQALEERLATLAPGTPRIASAHGQVPRAVLCGPTVAPAGLSALGDPGHDQRFESWHCQLLRRPEPPELRHWLGNAPAGLLRLKGCLPCADGRWMELQWAGRHGSVKPALRVPDDGAVVVAIGLRGQLPRAALAQILLSSGWPRQTPATVIQSASLPDQTQWLGTLFELQQPSEQLDLADSAASLLVIGKTVALSAQLLPYLSAQTELRASVG